MRFVGKSVIIWTFSESDSILFEKHDKSSPFNSTHLYRDIPTKWRSYRDRRLCDVTSSYVYRPCTVQALRLSPSVGRGSSPTAVQLYWTCGSCSCREHITNSVIGVSRPPVLDCGTTFHPDYGGRDLPSTPSDNL